MSVSNTITIPSEDLPNSSIRLVQKGRGSNKYLAWESTAECTTVEDSYRPDLERSSWMPNSLYLVTLNETEIHEFSAQALKELEAAQNALQRAEDRAESLRMFARELYAAPSLKVASE